jgi:peptide/nickel transport system permease protein
MVTYLLHRLFRTVIVLLVLTLAVFALLHLSGDPAAIMSPATASAADLDRIRKSLGLDAPAYIQYGRFLGQVFVGNFGTSWEYQQPALSLAMHRLPATLELSGSALVLGLVIGIPLGVIAAARYGKPVDFVSVSSSLAGRAMPSFWLGLMLIIFFGVKLRWLPTFGAGGFSNLILPSVTLAASFIADILLLTRSGMLEVLGEDYIRTAKAKGMSEIVVLLRHSLPNALLPIVSAAGVICSRLVGGAVVTETVFAWPGVGSMAVQAVSARDFPLVEACVFVLALCVALVNLFTDLSYGFFDPRIRHASAF